MLTLTEDKLTQIFIDCDDFMKDFQPWFVHHGIGGAASPVSKLSGSEIITICIAYHFSRYDCFKSFYRQMVEKQLKPYFPDIPSYPRFVSLRKHCLLEMSLFLVSRMSLPGQQANFIDSKQLPSCHIKREKNHKTMKGLASKGKTSTGWFFGLKLHLVINQYAQLCNFMLTGGRVSDNNGKALKTLFKRLKGLFFGDKGYLTKLKGWLSERGVYLVTKARKNMRHRKLALSEKHYLRHRGIIETVFGLLCFQADIDHARHRSQKGMVMNLFSGLLAYTYFDALPRLKMYAPTNQIALSKDLIK